MAEIYGKTETGEISKLENTMIFMDIDQTLADGVVPAHFEYYLDKFPQYKEELKSLNLTPEMVRESFKTESYSHIKNVPGFARFWGDGKDTMDPDFKIKRAALITDKDLHEYLLAKIPGAARNVWRLYAISGGLEYHTVRPSKIELVGGTEVDQMRSATQNWLGGFRNELGEEIDPKVFFPQHETTDRETPSVIMSQSPKQKLENILNHPTELKTKVLVDDGLEKLVDAVLDVWNGDNEQQKSELSKLVLVGFGFDQARLEKLLADKNIPETLPVRFLALPDWQDSNFDNLVNQLAQIQNQTT